MTRGGICKNIKKLMEAGLISSCQIDGNAKNIYYRLTDTGRMIYEKHAEAHEAWIARDMVIIKGFSDKQLEQVTDFMKRYIGHIEQRIEESENNGESKQQRNL